MSDFKIVKLLDPAVNITININPRGAWNSTTTYNIGDLVSYNGLSYIALNTNINQIPDISPTSWQVIVNADVGANWHLTGNTGTDPNVDYIGTNDNKPLIVRTNGNIVGQFDQNGRLGIGPSAPLSPVHIKPYSGYSGSGYRLEPFAVTTSSTSASNSFTFTMTNNQIVKIKYQVTGRQSDGTKRCSFTRTALFYREGANVRIEGRGWQSDFTAKSDHAFDVGYVLGTFDITFTVKAASSVDTHWVGHVEIEAVSTSI